MFPNRSRPQYCPFCGARLADTTDPLDAHLRDSDECRRQFDGWDAVTTPAGEHHSRRRTDVPAGGRGRTAMSVGRALLVLSIVGYSLLITQQPLLGVVAATLVYLVTHLGTLLRAIRGRTPPGQ